MNTDACNVEDINTVTILKNVCCVASFDDWSNIFRNRSFYLYKNNQDINVRSDSVAVLESINDKTVLCVG